MVSLTQKSPARVFTARAAKSAVALAGEIIAYAQKKMMKYKSK